MQWVILISGRKESAKMQEVQGGSTYHCQIFFHCSPRICGFRRKQIEINITNRCKISLNHAFSFVRIYPLSTSLVQSNRIILLIFNSIIPFIKDTRYPSRCPTTNPRQKWNKKHNDAESVAKIINYPDTGGIDMGILSWFQEGLGGFNRFCLVPFVLSIFAAVVLLAAFGLATVAAAVGGEGVDDALDYEVV